MAVTKVSYIKITILVISLILKMTTSKIYFKQVFLTAY